MKKESYYFSHDANARKDEKVLCLLVEHGYEGYGIYWALIEMMFENQDTAISRKLLKGIAYDLRIDITKLQSVITTCYSVNLFQADKEKIWSNSLRRRKAEWEEKRKKRSEAGKRGMASRWSPDNNVTNPDNNVITQNNGDITKYNKGKERKAKKSKVDRVFVPPTLEEVKAYFKEKGYSEELAERAFETYNVADWHDTKGNPVLSWKQKMVSTWLKPENKTIAPVLQLPTQREKLPTRLKPLNSAS